MPLLEYLLNKCSSEDLNRLIEECDDLLTLSEILDLKLNYVQKKQQHPICLPIRSLLKCIGDKDINIVCLVLEKALLVQPDDTQLLELANFISSYIDQPILQIENLYISLKLAVVILNICDQQNSVIIDRNTFQNLFYISDLNNLHNRKRNVIQESIKTENLALLHLLTDILISYKFETDLLTLLKNSELWFLIQNSLTNVRESFTQKQATNLLQRLINVALDKNVFSFQIPEIIKLKSVNTDISIMAWKNYFILIDTSKEKQLHLILPSIPLLKSVFCLHLNWIISILRILFSHSQTVVIFSVVNTVLQNEWLRDTNHFKAIIPDLLSAINKMEYFLLCTDTCYLFSHFVNSLCNNDMFVILLEESCKIFWNPVNLWVLYKIISSRNCKSVLSTGLVENVLNSLQKLPHKYIREGCIQLFVKFLFACCYDSSLTSLIKISSILFKIEKQLFVNYCAVFKEAILLNKQHVSNKLLSGEVTEKDVDVILEFAKLCNLHEIENLKNIKYNKFITEKLYVELYSSVKEEQKQLLFSYIKDRIKNISDEEEDTRNFKLLIRKLGADTEFCKKHEHEVRDICSFANLICTDDTDFTINQQDLAFEVTLSMSKETDFKEILVLWLAKYKKNYNITENISICILKLYFTHLLKNLHNMPQETIIEELRVVVENSFESQHGNVLLYIFEEMPHVLSKYNTTLDTFHLLERSVTEIINIIKTTYFKNAVEKFLKSLVKNTVIFNGQEEKLTQILKTFLDLSKIYDFIASILSKQIKNLAVENVQYAILCAPIIVELLVEIAWTKKEQRSEYDACKDIEKTLQLSGENPADHRTVARINISITILTVATNKQLPQETKFNFTDEICKLLLNKYKTNFNKRYFPDSTLHLQKLRIMQAFLTIEPHIAQNKRQELTELIITSFCSESHQFCVKQIMQWLLIRLLCNNKNSLTVIKDSLNSADRTRVSSITAFVPVLYHLTTNIDCEEVIDVILPWTMGAHFKLRLYAQIAICKLYEQAQRRDDKISVSKLQYLYNSLQAIVETMSADQINQVLQTDMLFFDDHFNPHSCYSLKTIYYEIPKVNSVIATEWYSLQNMDFPSFYSISGKSNTQIFPKTNNSSSKNRNIDDILNVDVSRYYLQKKITPWKAPSGNGEFAKQMSDFIVVATLVEKRANLGGLARTCEVFGVKELVLNDAKVQNDKEFKNLSMSAEDWLNITEVKTKDLKEFLLKSKLKDYTVVGAEQTCESSKLNCYKFPRKTVLVLGHEKEGISHTLLPFIDVCVEIPQTGVVRSLNVHVAGATFIWEYTKQILLDNNL